MKKSISLFLFASVVTAFLLGILTGCSSRQQDADTENLTRISYDALLQLPKTYLSESDSEEYESLEQYKASVFSRRKFQGALVSFECIDSTCYITVEHSGRDIMVSGKTLGKCRITAISETFNGCDLEVGSVIELEQEYYIFPVKERDKVAMFQSFGASIFLGSATGMKIDDGSYALNFREGVEYQLKIRPDTLPLEIGQNYTAVVVTFDNILFANYIAPMENEKRYEGFQISQYSYDISKEVKDTFVSGGLK